MRRNHLDAMVHQNRIRAVSRTVVQGGQEGQELAKAARKALQVKDGMAELDGVMKPKFVPGLHPVDQSGQYVIP